MEGYLANLGSNELRSEHEQTTVLAGPARDISLAACAYEIMNKAGLRSLEETYAAVRLDPGVAIHVTVDSKSNELQISDVEPTTRGWVVVEQFADLGEPRGWLFNTEAGAAAFYGKKLMLQNAGVVTVRHDDGSGTGAAHYAGAGFSGISALTMSVLPGA
jgi:hypothetical protein